MRVLITNVTGLRNKGVEALVKSTIRGILGFQSEAKFTIMSSSPDYDQLFLTNAFPGQVTCLRTPPFLGTSDLPGPMTPPLRFYPTIRCLPFIPRLSWLEAALSAVKACDVVIVSGGDVLSSEYGNLADHLRPIRLAKSLGKPVVLLGHSIGPFKHEKESELFRVVCGDLPLITLREPRSYEYVRQLLGREEGIHLTADVAFTMPPAPREISRRLLDFYGVPSDKPLIGFAVSQGISDFSGTSRSSHYEVIREAVRGLVARGYHVVLVPHVQERFTTNNDRLLVSSLARDLGFVLGLSAVTGDHTAEELKGIIGRCHLLVAERTHAAIAGMSQGIPTINIAYSVKAYGITDILYEHVADQFRIAVGELSAQTLIDRILDVLDHGVEHSQQLRDKMAQVNGMAQENFRLLRQLLSVKSPVA